MVHLKDWDYYAATEDGLGMASFILVGTVMSKKILLASSDNSHCCCLLLIVLLPPSWMTSNNVIVSKRNILNVTLHFEGRQSRNHKKHDCALRNEKAPRTLGGSPVGELEIPRLNLLPRWVVNESLIIIKTHDSINHQFVTNQPL